MADVKSFLLDYFRQRHFDLMTPAVRARFEEYKEKGDFTGNMKWWVKELDGKPVPELSTTLSPEQIEELYMMFQDVLQRMYAEKSSFIHDDVLTGFITKWFGSDYKTFDNTKVQNKELQSAIITLRQLLETGKSHGLPTILQTNCSDVFTDGFTYQELIKGLEKSKYNSDLNFRTKFIRVAEYVDYYGQQNDMTTWPQTLTGTVQGRDIDGTAVTLNLPLKISSDPKIGETSGWFAIKNKSEKIKAFTTDCVELLDKLLTSKKIRDAFTENGPGNTISKQLDKAIKDTDYENKESDDFIPEKTTDSKNIFQEIKSKLDDTFENYFRKFTNPTHGSRIYFSPYSQDIAKAFDKVGIKPTDGLEGIISNKDKILEKLASCNTATKHFKWFADTLSDIKSKQPKAYEGALQNGKQMRDLVSAIIVKAVKDNKIKEAKTTLEILSASKYGFTTSKTVDALQKTDFSLFGDKNLSWNKNEQFVTNAIDKTAKFAMVTTGRAVAGIYNLYQHKRTKIGKDIRDNKTLSDAYKQWVKEDANAKKAEEDTNTTHDVEGRLVNLNSGHGLSGLSINATNVDAQQALCDSLPSSDPQKDKLQADIDNYRDAIERKNLVDNWRDKNKDNFHELIAYWDMLESYTKTHSFTLGSMKVKREAMLKNWGDKTNPSKAETNVANYINNFGQLTY